MISTLKKQSHKGNNIIVIKKILTKEIKHIKLNKNSYMEMTMYSRR